MNQTLEEKQLTLISQETFLKGTLYCHAIGRIYGKVEGSIRTDHGSMLYICEEAHIKGNIYASTVFVGGCVEGDIFATKKLILTPTGRILGNIQAPKIQIAFGALLEGSCAMPSTHTKAFHQMPSFSEAH